jgi:hypothetical protein
MQRLTGLVVSLLLLLVAVSFGAQLLANLVFGDGATARPSAAPSVAHPLADLAVTLLALLFGIGLVVRASRWVRGEGGRRGRGSRGEGGRDWATRDFANDVPVERRQRRRGQSLRRRGD